MIMGSLKKTKDHGWIPNNEVIVISHWRSWSKLVMRGDYLCALVASSCFSIGRL